ncbi:MAG: cobalt-precorrin-5B (C(1))-methyltransferase [Verrucomicrobia bacterium]|nr:cobalt-precorrin-5B (C(1))-methyltransferase [Deltaproteobacteria bacterium]
MTQELRHSPSAPLRSGYTTGACAAAAAKGAALMLVHQITVNEVTIDLPAGISVTFPLSGQIVSPEQASCFVIKDAGDDPDVTNGAEVHATVRRDRDASPGSACRVIIEGGKGIGRVTKPGLAVPPGQWAINPVPRQMIEAAVGSALSTFNIQHSTFNIVISIPDGEERAKKTLNARLGIIGGLSILGTTGIVRPISSKAWTDTLDAALDVARACGCETVVLSTGRTSEMAAQHWLGSTSEEAFIMMGDHIAYALRACQLRGFHQPIIACQFAKLLKIACGHENTHAAASELDLAQLLTWGREGGLPEPVLGAISTANTAREIAIACSFDPDLLELVFRRARNATEHHAPDICPRFLVADYSGNCIFDSR